MPLTFVQGPSPTGWQLSSQSLLPLANWSADRADASHRTAFLSAVTHWWRRSGFAGADSDAPTRRRPPPATTRDRRSRAAGSAPLPAARGADRRAGPARRSRRARRRQGRPRAVRRPPTTPRRWTSSARRSPTTAALPLTFEAVDLKWSADRDGQRHRDVNISDRQQAARQVQLPDGVQPARDGWQLTRRDRRPAARFRQAADRHIAYPRDADAGCGSAGWSSTCCSGTCIR